MHLRRFATPMIALLSAGCVTVRSVEPHRIRPDDRLKVSAERPLMLRGTLQADRNLQFDCPLLAVEGRLQFVSGDSLWLNPIAVRTLAPGAAGECGSVDEGVLAVPDKSGVTFQRAEFNAAAAAVGLFAFVVLVVVVLWDFEYELRPNPSPAAP